MSELLTKVVIVGGGTAGWLTANHLAKALKPTPESKISITLIESPDIPTVGVGEGTVPLMRETLAHLGIGETEFLTECDATFKQSIKFVDWVYNPVQNTSNKKQQSSENRCNDFYHHVFNYPQVVPFNPTENWLNNDVNATGKFAEAVSFQSQICELGLAPKLITHPEYQGFCEYAYHLDAGKFSRLLNKNAVTRLGVKHVVANVIDTQLDVDGNIISVKTDQDENILGDLFIDCSGFRGLLIEKQLAVKFIGKKNILLADTALAMQVPYTSPDDPILSHTLATAQSAGWIWDIGLTTRRGVGHVYASQYIDHQQAEQELRQYVGLQAEHLECRRIDMRVGHREKFWVNNCIAIGLSQGFVEPLEATGLLMFDATARILAELFPKVKPAIPGAAQLFNQRALYIWHRVIDFIKLHYFLTQRTDTDFWKDNQKADTATDSLLTQLDNWRYRLPNEHDFFSRYETFNLDNYLYVLYGMNFSTQVFEKNRDCSNKLMSEPIKNYYEQINQQVKQLSNQLESNRELLDKVKRFGLQKC
ncbi:tryptophan halogenase family protein [Aliikangiella sp. IMCC44359]|uniref:tryptophan halogenase family protein n=1 Tax=Aliikangiella sp. IMCC44359 TaxID=3459125 RepID=UPI00403AC88F